MFICFIGIFPVSILLYDGFYAELTELQFVHTTFQRLPDQSAIMDNRFIETVAAGEIIGIKTEPGQNPACDIAAQAALTYHIDRLVWL